MELLSKSDEQDASKVEIGYKGIMIVQWQVDQDPRNPKDWSLSFKWLITLYITAIGFVVTMAGSINSGANLYAAEKFKVNDEVMNLQTGIFLLGFGLSAPVMGSLSEIHGRYPLYIITLLFFSVFSLGSGFAHNIQTRVILRFFAGLFGAAPFSNSGGSIADMADGIQRTFLYPVYSVLSFTAVALGPIFGGWIGERADESYCDWVTAILGFSLTFFLFIFMPETHSMQLLKYRAKSLRRMNNSDKYKTPLEAKLQENTSGFSATVASLIVTPVMFLVTEPITWSFALYSTVVFVIMFGDLELFPVLFDTWYFSPGESGSTFTSILVGMCLTSLTIYPMYKHYQKLVEKARAGTFPAPEQRLWISIFGTWLMPASLFWGGWVTYEHISPWVLIVSQSLFGFGSICCYISTQMYIIDVYQVNCASPLATMTFLRYIVGGTCSVMWTKPMLEGIGKHWAMSLLGFVSLATSLIPIFFFVFGPKVRQKSSYALAKQSAEF